MREDDRTGVSETRPDRQYRMPPCPIRSQFRVVGHASWWHNPSDLPFERFRVTLNLAEGCHSNWRASLTTNPSYPATRAAPSG